MNIFVAAGHGGLEDDFRDPGAIAFNTTETAELLAVKDLLLLELKSRNLKALAPEDDLGLMARIAWINARGSLDDVALEINMNAFDNPDVRGISAYYIALNAERQRQADRFVETLVSRIPELPNRGAKPDTNAALGRLAFCRDVIPSSLVIELGFLTNPQDLRLMQTRRRDIAIALADGVQAWLDQIAMSSYIALPLPSTVAVEIPREPAPRANAPSPMQTLPTPAPTSTSIPSQESSPQPNAITAYPRINIKLNGQAYDKSGILVAGNAYIPEELLNLIGLEPAKTAGIRRIKYGDVIYIQAIALRDFDISVDWRADTRTVLINTVFKVCVGTIGQIMGCGNATAPQLLKFLEQKNAVAARDYRELPAMYYEEAGLEGVNHDVAFCQMCLETNFLKLEPRLGKSFYIAKLIKSENVDNLSDRLSSLKDKRNLRTMVRAHIQRLKNYASNAPLAQLPVEAQLQFTVRGAAPTLDRLGTIWTSDPKYADKVIAILRLLYEFINIL